MNKHTWQNTLNSSRTMGDVFIDECTSCPAVRVTHEFWTKDEHDVWVRIVKRPKVIGSPGRSRLDCGPPVRVS